MYNGSVNEFGYGRYLLNSLVNALVLIQLELFESMLRYVSHLYKKKKTKKARNEEGEKRRKWK